MKRKTLFTVISSLIFFTVISCGISVPFLFDSSKVSISRYGQGHRIEVRDPEYTIGNGYHISVMYLYCITESSQSDSSYWTSFSKNAQYDSLNSKTFNLTEKSINPPKEKDKTEYPVFMLHPVDKSSKYNNSSPDYLINQHNAGFIPGEQVKLSYSWDEDGHIVITLNGAFGEDSYTMERANGESFRNNDLSEDDPEFRRTVGDSIYELGNRWTVHIMPVVYARSDNHPNQKFYMNTGSSADLDVSDIRTKSEDDRTETDTAVPGNGTAQEI